VARRAGVLARIGSPALVVGLVSGETFWGRAAFYGADSTRRRRGIGGPDPVGAASGFLVGAYLNAIVGVVLLFLTNIVLADDLPINLLTIVICAIGGVVGWLIILALHILGIAF